MAGVTFEAVDVVFGPQPEEALDLLDGGAGRALVFSKTHHVVGVANATFSVEHGEICVLTGRSGSGKSTLLRAVNGLCDVTRGNVLIQDIGERVDVSRCNAKTLRHLRTRRISMVFRHPALLPWRTVRENVGFGLEIRGMKRRQRERVIDGTLQSAGLAPFADDYAHELSSDMQQRVGLARAFATDADILLMDAPFSDFDPLTRVRLQNELLDLQRKLKKTIIFASDDLGEAIRIGRHIVIMEEGRIVQHDRPETVVLNPVNRHIADALTQMNPLNLLQGASVMTPIDNTGRRDNAVALDPSGRIRLALSNGALTQKAMIGGRAAPVVNWAPNMKIDDKLKGRIAAAPANITLRTALELRHRTGHPIVLVDGKRLIGVIGDDEIYRGILRQAAINSG